MTVIVYYVIMCAYSKCDHQWPQDSPRPNKYSKMYGHLSHRTHTLISLANITILYNVFNVSFYTIVFINVNLHKIVIVLPSTNCNANHQSRNDTPMLLSREAHKTHTNGINMWRFFNPRHCNTYNTLYCFFCVCCTAILHRNQAIYSFHAFHVYCVYECEFKCILNKTEEFTGTRSNECSSCGF